MRIVTVSDTHGLTPDLPGGDILIHAGDGTLWGKQQEVNALDEWFGSQKKKFQHILFTPGNHDFWFQIPNKLNNAIVLINQRVIFRGVTFWFSPFSIQFGSWAFMKVEEELRGIWEGIPENVDVLVTHGPPFLILDRGISGEHVGSTSLLSKVLDLKPKYHIFGHIHEEAGIVKGEDTLFINASIVDEFYRKTNEPIIIDI